MKQRIWELDAFRGVCVLGMVAVHFVYDLAVLYRLVDWTLPQGFLFLQSWGGILFLVLSGICATLGKHNLKRGAVVFSCGLLISLVTFAMYRFFAFHKSILIYFGVLHCLGLCMILWQLVKKQAVFSLLSLGAVLVAIGFYLMEVTVSFPWLLFLGLTPEGFATADYFPLLPYFGFFLLGGGLGRLLYPTAVTRFPKANQMNPIIRFFTFCGRQSLWIYLLHQPALSAVFFLLNL